MRKPKTKKMQWDVTVTEAEKGVWTWRYREVGWKWDGAAGINTYVQWEADTPWVSALAFDKLADAVWYSLGYGGGYDTGVEHGRKWPTL